MDLQYDGSLTDWLMNDTDLYDDTIQSNPTVLAPIQNEVVPRLRMTHPHLSPAAGVPATAQKSPAVTSND